MCDDMVYYPILTVMQFNMSRNRKMYEIYVHNIFFNLYRILTEDRIILPVCTKFKTFHVNK